jgi:hypothetical protein
VLADFNADTYADLAVGAVRGRQRRRQRHLRVDDRAVGHRHPDQLWSQGSPDVEGTPNRGDEFGFTVAAT